MHGQLKFLLLDSFCSILLIDYDILFVKFISSSKYPVNPDGFTSHPSKKCEGTTLYVSRAHTTPYDCHQLCIWESRCNAFIFSNLFYTCEILIKCTQPMMEDDNYDLYIRTCK